MCPSKADDKGKTGALIKGSAGDGYIDFQDAQGAWVGLHTIQTVVRVTSAPAPPVIEGGGGGGEASQGSQLGVDCWRCGNFVGEGEECECEHIACLCGQIVQEKDYLGECVGCEKHLANCCGAINENDDPICHPCSHTAEEEEGGDLEDFEVKGVVCLFNSETGAVFSKKANGTPGDKVSTYKDGKHTWEWSKKKIGETFYLINYFNYVAERIQRRRLGGHLQPRDQDAHADPRPRGPLNAPADL